MTHIFLFAAQLFYVSLKAFQQLNVMHHKPMWVFWTSGGMAMFEIGVYGSITFQAYETINGGSILGFVTLAIPLWLGGAIGSNISMALHRKMRRPHEHREEPTGGAVHVRGDG